MGDGKNPRLYKDIVVHFLEYSGFEKCNFTPVSRESFIKYVQSFKGDAVFVPLEEFEGFDRNKIPKLTVPEEVELHDGAEFVVIMPESLMEDVRLASTSFSNLNYALVPATRRRSVTPKFIYFFSIF